MKTKFYLTLILLFFAVYANAQNTIKGKIVENDGQKPIELASVALFKSSDSLLLSGAVTNADGQFSITNVANGNYYVRISLLGYKTIFQGNIVLSKENKNTDLGNIVLPLENQNLQEITVEAERLKGKEEVDKTVYALNDKVMKASSNGLDVLKKIPAIQVDIKNNISLEGSQNILIMVDGKQREKEFLSNINPETIDKVEVITNPSSKYDANITGVINIVTKRTRNLGVSTNGEIELPTSKSEILSNNNAGIDIGYNKLHAYISYYGHIEKFNVFMETVHKNLNNDSIFGYRFDGKGDFKWRNDTYNFGLDYFINDKNSINFYGNIHPNGGYFKHDILQSIFTKRDTTFNESYRRSDDDYTSGYYSIFYKKTFAKPVRELTFETSYYNSDGSSKVDYIDDKAILENSNQVHRYEETTTKRNSVNTKVDFVDLWSGKYRFESGFQNYIQNIDMSYNETNRENLNNLPYQEIRNAGYANISGKIKEFSWQIGARVEYTTVFIDDAKFTSYGRPLPNINLQQKLKKGGNLKLTFRSSIDRPGSEDLNPFVTTSDEYNTKVGNPKLKPCYTNKLKLSYTKNFKNNFISPYIYVDHYKDYFEVVKHDLGNSKIESITDNIANGFEYGAGFSASFAPAKWIYISPSAKIYNIHAKPIDENNAYGIEERDELSYQVGLTAVFTVLKDMNIIWYSFYNSPQISAQNKNYRSMIYLLALEKPFFKQHAKIGINWYVPFMKEFTFQRSEVVDNKNFYEDNKNYIDTKTPLISFKLTFNLSNGKQMKKLDRQINGEQDTKKGGF